MNVGMEKYLFTIILSLFLGFPIPALADDQLSIVLDGVRKKYGSLPGLTVKYEREIISKSMAMLGETMKTDLASGRIHFKPPDSLKIEQERPRPETLLTDGHILWWYIPHKNEVYRYPSHKLGEELRLLVDIFHGLKNADEGFRITLSDTRNRSGGHQITLSPDPPWPQVERIHLSVDQDDYRIQRVEIFNHIGGMTRFNLGDLVVKENFEKDFFRFLIPNGVKVIEEAG